MSSNNLQGSARASAKTTASSRDHSHQHENPQHREQQVDMSAAINWTDEEYANFGLVPQVSQHRYNELPLFGDDELIELLNHYPRRNLQAYHMGEDPLANEDWKQVDIAEHTTGEQMLQAVKTGRIWINLTHIENNSADYAKLIDGMYQHLGKHCPHLKNPKGTHSALLISSPGAQVYYHLDAEPNMLWHMRGQKHMWVYPAMNLDIVPQDYLEDIYSGEIGENLPYKPEYDALAQQFLLNPGDAASWPHNGPHRIVNIDMNVSLATSYYTPVIYKRQYVQLANRFLLRNLGIKNRSVAESGPIAAAKRITYRILNKLKPFKRRDRAASYITDLQLDPTAPLGVRKLPEPKLASFASKPAEASGTTGQPQSAG